MLEGPAALGALSLGAGLAGCTGPSICGDGSCSTSCEMTRDEDGEYGELWTCEGMYGKGTSRGLSNEACRFEKEVLRRGREGRSPDGRV